jgi:hypothetical protein
MPPRNGRVPSRREILSWALGYPLGATACAQLAGLSDDYHRVPGGAGQVGAGQGGAGHGAAAQGGTSDRGGLGGTGGRGSGASGGAAGEAGHESAGASGEAEVGASGRSTGGAGVGGNSTGGSGATAGAGNSRGTGGASTAGAPATGGASMSAGGSPGAGGSASGGVPQTGGNGGSGGSIGGKENNWVDAGCVIGTPPGFANSVTNSKLPDPFKFINGTRITRKADWECLRADLSALVQDCIYGPKMPPPDSLTASYSAGKLTVNMTVGSNTGSFSVTISGGGTADNPVPVIIACGASELPASAGVATITMVTNTIALQTGSPPMINAGGLVTTLYGNLAAKSGALIGWAWGLSRIIDGLELCPEAGIDLKAIAVTGCSIDGKGALAMGAFDERVALTIPQEAGCGGPALWRVSQQEKALGQNIQESSEIIGEANLLGSNFAQYATGLNDKLSADQHTVVALCAPRAVLIIENDIDWLGPVACYGGGKAAAHVYQALGIQDRIGVSVSPNHGHCVFPSSQQAYLSAFIERFLMRATADTSGVDDFNASASDTKLGTFDEATWIDWDVPTLSGNLAWDPFAV